MKLPTAAVSVYNDRTDNQSAPSRHGLQAAEVAPHSFPRMTLSWIAVVLTGANSGIKTGLAAVIGWLEPAGTALAG